MEISQRSNTRIQVSLDPDLLERIDAFTKKSSINRSALISMACASFIDAQEKMPELQSQIALLNSEIEKLKLVK